MAILADASDEGLFFTRILDCEETDTAQLQDAVRNFIGRLEMLFTEKKCLELPGYASFMLKSLARPRVLRNLHRTIGGPGVPLDAIKARCLQRNLTTRLHIRVSTHT